MMEKRDVMMNLGRSTHIERDVRRDSDVRRSVSVKSKEVRLHVVANRRQEQVRHSVEKPDRYIRSPNIVQIISEGAN